MHRDKDGKEEKLFNYECEDMVNVSRTNRILLPNWYDYCSGKARRT